MLIAGFKSRPTDDELHPITRATRHTIAAQHNVGERALPRLKEMTCNFVYMNPGRVLRKDNASIELPCGATDVMVV